MDPPHSLPDRTNKKVSRACNTCRLKRKKCNGLDPCLFCTENRIECSYSREPRRRGPPSGYLRYTETRVALFEIMLGLFVSQICPISEKNDAMDPLYEAAQTLLAESKSSTQDVWDGYRRGWTVCQSAKIIDELAITFAPYSQRPDQEVASRPLLRSSVHPNANGGASARIPDTPLPPRTPSPRNQTILGPSSMPWAAATAAVPPDSSASGSDYGALDFASSTTPTLSRESFERCSALLQSTQHPEPTEAPTWRYTQSRLEVAAAEYGLSPEGKGVTPSTGFSLDDDDTVQDNSNLLPSPVNENSVASFEDQGTNYTGSYWRSVDLAMSDSPNVHFTSQSETCALSSPVALELPPSHVLSKMIDVYYNNVWSTFPFLPTRPTVESLLSSMPIQSEAFTAVLLALCAYCSHLSPASEDSSGTGDAGMVAENMWYERARSGVFLCIRRGSSVELVQALLLLALNDHGKGNETQAWMFVGMAVRAGQDMDLNGDLPTTYSRFPPEEIRLRRNIWSVSLMLDLFLSLQLGRPPASFDCLRSAPTNTHESEYANHPVPIFLYAVALCRIISRINLHLYLGYNTPDLESRTEKLNKLRDELEAWYRFLPAQYRVAVGHQADRTVLELNMLYHVAVILLYRPFVREHVVQHAMDSLTEAATAFNGLLEKYRQIQSDSLVSSSPPLSLSNPNMIYIIFSVAIAHLSGYKMRRPQSNSKKANMALQTELHLFNCLEALTSIGVTWKLARRCWKTLDKLVESEGLKPQSNTMPSESSPQNLGKRKREDDDITRNSQRPFTSGGTRDLLPGVHINPDSTLSTFERTLGSSTKSLTSSSIQRQRTSDSPEHATWEDAASATPAFTTLSIPAHTPPSELFSSTEYSSARWLPESQIGLDMVWNGEWNDQLWIRSAGSIAK